MLKLDRISGIVLLCVGLSICMGAWALGPGTPATPGPGFFPLLAGGSLCFFALLILMDAKRNAAKYEGHKQQTQEKKPMVLALLCLLLWVLILEVLGFALSNAVFFILLCRFTGRLSWRVSFIYGLAGALLTWFSFVYLLNSPMPRGELIDWLRGF